jgi:hypothetical protein
VVAETANAVLGLPRPLGRFRTLYPLTAFSPSSIKAMLDALCG